MDDPVEKPIHNTETAHGDVQTAPSKPRHATVRVLSWRSPIIATWAGVLVNTAVVFVALFSPRWQEQHLSRVRSVELWQDKAALIADMTWDYNSGLSWLNNENIDEPNRDIRINKFARTSILYQFKINEYEALSSVSQKRAALASGSYPTVLRVLSERYLAVNIAQAATAHNMIEYMSLAPDASLRAIEKQEREFNRAVEIALRSERYVIESNQDHVGKITALTYAGDCTTNQDSESCSRPLRYMVHLR